MPALLLTACSSGLPSETASVSGGREDPFLDTLQHDTFLWFWEQANPQNGLTPDRRPTQSFSSVAAIGFALTAYPVGVEHEWVTRDEAAERTLTTLRFLWEAPQGPQPTGVIGHRGLFYHFLDMDTGHRFKTVELSTIDTALLIGGVLFAGEYFDADDPQEAEIRAYADSLYRRVDWTYIQPRPPLIGMAWHPERGFGRADYTGYNEAMLLYILALGSPTHPIDVSAWDVYTSTYQWGPFYGYEHVNFAPLFGHQYSHVWIDFQGIQDEYMREKGIDYFENSRRATLAQRAYAIDNPGGFEDFSGSIWGLTASDGPANVTELVQGDSVRFHTYWARGAALGEIRDDGTIAPTAAGGSIPFAPDITIAALKAMKARYGDLVYNRYGFMDAFNPTFTFRDVATERGTIDPEHGWFDSDQLGIDQGPIVTMIENYRNGLVWGYMRENPYIVRGLCRAGFSGGWIEGKCSE